MKSSTMPIVAMSHKDVMSAVLAFCGVKDIPDFSTRPTFGPSQIRSIKQLRIGMSVCLYDEGIRNGERIKSARYSKANTIGEQAIIIKKIISFGKIKYLKVRYVQTRKICEIILSDFNVIPYSDGNWYSRKRWIGFVR